VSGQLEELRRLCGYCQGSGVVRNHATDANGERLIWASPCPVCRPRPEHPDSWRAVAAPRQPDGAGTGRRRPLSGLGRPQPTTWVVL
jgi:hypothetical protein